ncbi:MAG: UDP-N-acetylmuramoyl-L-alanyl-D-glutamate--2,6-diaminopimelate ligase [Clostridiales Family XIII bacterium]|jgi:UDP-N-acetylmuramoyl-L-alanyl-D-glutamate--2,6-diaminopimelate ligase|nr:UDP-N-acetylmuramoyl-L-alanyl-D-glutamate--2,6-diaminopimelate ligase [Clostridiales Family XIII bacterium]
MKLADVLKGIDCNITAGSLDIDIAGIASDSRKVDRGYLFVALPGRNSDGHDYAEEAVALGAAAVAIMRKGHEVFRCGAPGQATVIETRNTKNILSLLANNFYGHPYRDTNLIGVTGTNGKTSVATMLSSVLSALGRKTGLISTIGTVFEGEELDVNRTTPTTPEAIELGEILDIMRRKGAKDVVMEVSSMGLKMKRVSAMEYAVGVFTNISPEHMDDHGTMEDYGDSKKMLFPLSRSVVVNADDPFATEMLSAAIGKKAIRFAILDVSADLTAENLLFSNDKVIFDLVLRDGRSGAEEYRRELSLDIPGQFAVYNILAVTGICLQLGIDIDEVANVIAGGQINLEVPGRYEIVMSGDGVTAIVDYAHTAGALENLLRTVRQNSSYGKIISVFGCGGDRDPSKRAPMGEISGGIADVTFITSDNPRSEEPEAIISMIEKGIKKTGGKYRVEPDRKKAITKAIAAARPGDVVVIAGKGHEPYQILKNRTIEFDDKKTVSEIFEGRKE